MPTGDSTSHLFPQDFTGSENLVIFSISMCFKMWFRNNPASVKALFVYHGNRLVG